MMNMIMFLCIYLIIAIEHTNDIRKIVAIGNNDDDLGFND